MVAGMGSANDSFRREVSRHVTFGAPGTFVVRLMAHDGGLDATSDVTVTVLP
jgi:hypothetical protein